MYHNFGIYTLWHDIVLESNLKVDHHLRPSCHCLNCRRFRGAPQTSYLVSCYHTNTRQYNPSAQCRWLRVHLLSAVTSSMLPVNRDKSSIVNDRSPLRIL
ncbi:unnamed protein product [Laminaria digitata]